MPQEYIDIIYTKQDGIATVSMNRLAGAARLLARRRDSLAGNVKLLFQPGEEGYGGARILIGEANTIQRTSVGIWNTPITAKKTPILTTNNSLKYLRFGMRRTMI